MNNKTIIIAIVLVAIATVVVVSWKTPTKGTDTNNVAQQTATPTPTVTEDNPFVVTETPTPTVTSTVTVTATTTPTATPSGTVTPTVTSSTGTFSTLKSADWLYGTTQQKVGTVYYYINPDNAKQVVKGTSYSDPAPKNVYTSDTNGEIGSFVINGSSMYVIVKRDSSTNYSKFKKVALSNGSAARLYDFTSVKYEATNFAVRKDANTKAGFYLGLEGVENKYEPAAVYIENYAQKWVKYFTGEDKTGSFKGLAPSTDGKKLLGLFTVGSSDQEGEITL